MLGEHFTSQVNIFSLYLSTGDGCILVPSNVKTDTLKHNQSLMISLAYVQIKVKFRFLHNQLIAYIFLWI